MSENLGELDGVILEFFSDCRYKRFVRPRVAEKIVGVAEGLFVPQDLLLNVSKHIASFAKGISIIKTPTEISERVVSLSDKVYCMTERGTILGYLIPWYFKNFIRPPTVLDLKILRELVSHKKIRSTEIPEQPDVQKENVKAEDAVARQPAYREVVRNTEFPKRFSAREDGVKQENLDSNGEAQVVLNPDSDHAALAHLSHGSYLVHRHALGRFIEKRGDFQANTAYEAALRAFLDLFKRSVLVERRNNVRQIIKHNFREAEYRYNGGWIFVVEVYDGKRIVKTCYPKPGKLKWNGYRVVKEKTEN